MWTRAAQGKPATGVSSRRGLLITRTVLLSLVALLIASAIYTSMLIIERQTALRQVSRYNVSWTVSQAAMEVTRLQAAVGAFAIHPGARERAAVRLWMDIVASRIPLLEAGEVGDFIRGQPDRQATVEEFKAAAAAADALLPAIDQPGTAYRLVSLLSRLNPKLGQLASAAHAAGAHRTTRDIQELGRLHWMFSCVLIGLIACSFVLIGVLFWNNGLLLRAHNDVQSLVGDLREKTAALASAHQQVKQAMEEVQLQNLILKERDRDLQTQYTRFDAALNNMSQGLCMVDAQQRLIVCNRRFLELFGLSTALARPGVPVVDLFRAISSSSASGANSAAARGWQEQRVLAQELRSGTFVVEGSDGRALAVSHRLMEHSGWVATYEDVTEQRTAEARIRFMAHHDALTGLPNRALFRDRMDEALRRRNPGGGGLALLCLDLDNFKTVNDTLGHPVGDALLEAAGQRLQNCVRGEDIVARLGGDEFAIVQVAPGQPEQAEALARRIIEQMNAPYDVSGRRVVSSVSIGIALADSSEASADLLLKNADMALYRAKAAGRGTYCFFEPEMDAEVQARLSIESDLRDALEHHQFEVYYQPLFNLTCNRVSGLEALLRWRHPERGLIPPSQFIPIAEELGVITQIGDWILQQACMDAASWPEKLKVAVNLSPIQFRYPGLVQSVAEALRRSGLEPGRLELEVTESALLQDNAGTLAVLHELRGLGLRIALDDFGTGYSSLSYLRSFPFDKIKIDRSFVSEMGNRPDCQVIVRSIAELAANLGITTTAEGVESSDHLNLIREAGCTEGQGYHFGRPTPASEVGALLERLEPGTSFVSAAA